MLFLAFPVLVVWAEYVVSSDYGGGTSQPRPRVVLGIGTTVANQVEHLPLPAIVLRRSCDCKVFDLDATQLDTSLRSWILDSKDVLTRVSDGFVVDGSGLFEVLDSDLDPQLIAIGADGRITDMQRQPLTSAEIGTLARVFEGRFR